MLLFNIASNMMNILICLLKLSGGFCESVSIFLPLCNGAMLLYENKKFLMNEIVTSVLFQCLFIFSTVCA